MMPVPRPGVAACACGTMSLSETSKTNYCPTDHNRRSGLLMGPSGSMFLAPIPLLQVRYFGEFASKRLRDFSGKDGTPFR